MNDDVKICPRCLLDRPLSHFKLPSGPPSGPMHRWCADCRSLANRARHLYGPRSHSFYKGKRPPSGVGDIIEGPFVDQLCYVFRQLEEMEAKRG